MPKNEMKKSCLPWSRHILLILISSSGAIRTPIVLMQFLYTNQERWIEIDHSVTRIEVVLTEATSNLLHVQHTAWHDLMNRSILSFLLILFFFSFNSVENQQEAIGQIGRGVPQSSEKLKRLKSTRSLVLCRFFAFGKRWRKFSSRNYP